MKLEKIPWPGGERLDETALRRRLESEGFEVWGWTDGAGADYQPHAHDHDESVWVVAGERRVHGALRQHEPIAGGAGATYLIGEKR